ncbi:MAG: hypothetical protein KDD92_04355 [Caldilineaceae bacterium]|nr:hypothetical protein [Caldilineaceae bacterium]
MQHKGDPAWDVVAAYAQGLNVSYEEAEARFGLQDQFSALTGELEEKDPTYGGAWIEHEPEFGLYVQFAASDGAARLKAYAEKYPFVDQVRVLQSRYSLKELMAMKDVLTNSFAAANKYLIYSTGIGVDERSIKITIRAGDLAETERLLATDSDLATLLTDAVGERAPERVLDIVRVEYGEPDVPLSYPNYYGGGGLGVALPCTPGLALVEYSTGEKYVSSAAHCLPNLSLNGHSLGPIVHERDFGPPYYSDVRVMDAEATGWNITNRIACGSSLCERINGYAYRTNLDLGTYVAHRGSMSNFAIAEILNTNVTALGSYTGFVRAESPSWWWPGNNPAGCKGDSGGAVFQVTSYPYADGVGVVSLGNIPINEAETCFKQILFPPLDKFPSGFRPLTQ